MKPFGYLCLEISFGSKWLLKCFAGAADECEFMPFTNALILFFVDDVQCSLTCLKIIERTSSHILLNSCFQPTKIQPRVQNTI